MLARTLTARTTAKFGSTGVDVAVVGQGTWNLEHDATRANGARAEVVEALRRGIDLGLTHIDTAEMYGGGVVEEIVGDAIAGRREEIFLVSKVLPSNASKHGTIDACERSLKRLRTDHLDVLLLHWRGRHPLADTIAAFESLVADGKIRAWGVSNFDVDDMIEVLSIAGPARCACNQVLYHLDERYADGELLDVCRENDVALVAYSPFGSGSFPHGARRKVLDEIARAHAVDAHAVALAFLLRDGVFVIPKASTRAHVESNARALSLSLTEVERARIDAAFPRRGRRLSSI